MLADLQFQKEEVNWHIMTRKPLEDLPDFDTELNLNRTVEFGLKKEEKRAKPFQIIEKRANGDLTIETAVFLDPTAYR